MSSAELSGWWVLWQVRAEEAEIARLKADEPDGQVFINGRSVDAEYEDDGETE